MAKAAKAAAAKKPAASAKGDKAPTPSKAKGPNKDAAAAVNSATAAAVSLKQMAAGLAESNDLPKRQVEAMLDAFVQRFAEHLRQGSNFRIPGLRILQVSARAARMGAAGRERVLSEFGWPAVSQQTVGVYTEVLAARG